MMQVTLERWQVVGAQIHLMIVLWWLNRRLDLITWRLRLNAVQWDGWQRQAQCKRR